MKQLARIMFVTTVSVLVAVVAFGSLFSSDSVSDEPVTVMAASSVSVVDTFIEVPQASESFTQIYYNVSPSVVAISVSTVSRNRVIAAGTGSGFVIDADGHILTNYHVVDTATQIEIEFYDGTLAWAEVVGVDPDSDLAVLKVDVSDAALFPVTFGDSGALQIGETVLAIGSPFGQDWTPTTGIVSGLDRTIKGQSQYSTGGVIQTDAAINPGNSGGPLLDADGHVIGVNSQIATTTESNSGVGFAVPGNLALRVAQDLIADGEVGYSYIGISGTDLTLSLIDSLGLPSGTRGIAVAEVVSGGPADYAGLQSASQMTVYDVITAIDGYSLKGMDDLISYLARETEPGQTVKLTVLNENDSLETVDLTLAERP